MSAGTAFGQWGPARVEISKVVEESLAPTIRLVGTVHPQKRTTVAAEVWGFVTDLPVEIGDSVRKGDLLCKLRDTQHRYNLEEAKARVDDLQAAVRVAVADLTKAKFEEDRINSFTDAAEKEKVDAAANLEAARARVSQAEASLKSAEAVRERLRDSLQRTEVLAPFDGHVVSKMTEVGSWVEQGGAVVSMIDLATARVRLNVPEAYIGFNPVGVESPVFVDALNQEFLGRVARVIPDADQQARTFPVDIDIPNSDGSLKAGMFVRGSLASGPIGKQLVVPKDAIVTRGPMTFLFTVKKAGDGAVADMKPVRIISEVLDRVAVDVPGLQAGDDVVIRGNEMMFSPGPVIIMSGGSPQPEKSESMPASQPVAGESAGKTMPQSAQAKTGNGKSE